MPSLRRLAREASGRGIVVLAVSVGEARRQVAEFLKDGGIGGATVLVDPTAVAFRKFGLRGHPAVVGIDLSGKKRWLAYSFTAALQHWDRSLKDPGRFLR